MSRAPRTRPLLRSTLVPAARYDAAGGGRRMAKWSPPSSGPNRVIQGLQKIRDRARDVARNEWGGRSATQKWVTNLVGVGIVPRWANMRLEPMWRKWVREADADGVLDLYGLQTLVVRTWLDAGECFVRERPREVDSPLSAPVQVQLLEPEMCPLLDAAQWPGLPAGNEIRQGVEINKYGRRQAYWFYRSHPGDGTLGTTPRMDDLVRVAASQVRHVFEPERPGQLRGVSHLASVLLRLRDSADYEDNVLTRQKLANLFTVFLTRTLPEKFLGELDLNPLTGMPKVWDDEGNMLVGLEPGAAMELKPGEDVKFANPPEAGTTYSEYMRTLHLGTAAGGGLPYELYSGDIKDVSDRTLRVVVNEFRRFAQQRQWQIIIPQFAQPCVEWWADALLLSGQISPVEHAEAREPKHSPHGWEYIHPVQDVEGKIKAIQAGITSRDAIIGERGDDPRAVDQERSAGEAREAALGLSKEVVK